MSEDIRHFDDESKVEITFNFMSTASASESECHPPGCDTLKVSANAFYIMICGRQCTLLYHRGLLLLPELGLEEVEDPFRGHLTYFHQLEPDCDECWGV